MNCSYSLKHQLKFFAKITLFFFFLIGCKMPIDVRLRNKDLPLFEPHVATFTCEVESAKVPLIDPEAETWFHQARILESPDILPDDRNYAEIVKLTQKAAERHHWKAMLNLASLYIENRVLGLGTEDAVNLVEKAMQLGIPAAYDRMGIYYLNGTGVPHNGTKAYAFMQRAAQMGNPQAMTFLAEKLNAGPDSVDATHWSNIPVATKMLECALSQGYGPAAFDLHYLYASPRNANGWIIGNDTTETKTQALKVLHKGVRLGCKDCAGALRGAFNGFNLTDTVVPHIDKSRAERYRVFSNELSFNPSARFPNLDKVLPLPPADLPPWNGDRDTLLAAAMGVSLPLTPAKTIMASNRIEQSHPDLHYKLRASGEQTVAEHASLPGYWQPAPVHYHETACQVLESTPARPYRAGEPFATLFLQTGGIQKPIENVLWRHFHTLRHNHGVVEPIAVPGLTRVVPHRDTMLMAKSEQMCPSTGTWQPWIDAAHPMQAIVNQPWRQAWLNEGATFPQPDADWLLALPSADITWYLLDDTGIDIS
jgi:hypothetical protein